MNGIFVTLVLRFCQVNFVINKILIVIETISNLNSHSKIVEYLVFSHQIFPNHCQTVEA